MTAWSALAIFVIYLIINQFYYTDFLFSVHFSVGALGFFTLTDNASLTTIGLSSQHDVGGIKMG